METTRLYLRAWQECDADELFKYAKDPLVGPAAGWIPHTSLENSREIIRSILSKKETYAICLKSEVLIGSIGLHLKGDTDKTKRDDECELGYWIARPFWGKGLATEAASKLLSRAFIELQMRAVWCGYYDGNIKSKRVQEKLGFEYHHMNKNFEIESLNESRTEYVNLLTKERWQAVAIR